MTFTSYFENTTRISTRDIICPDRGTLIPLFKNPGILGEIVHGQFTQSFYDRFLVGQLKCTTVTNTSHTRKVPSPLPPFPPPPRIAIQTGKDKNMVPSDFSKCYKNTDDGRKSLAKKCLVLVA
jgi:hypothetical protein